MPRIRSMKPEFWGDDAISSLSIEARYVYLGLISFADDEGRFIANVRAVSGYVFPLDNIAEVKVRKLLDEIRRKAPRSITWYQVNGHSYGVFRNYRAGGGRK